MITEEQKNWAPAGNANGDRWTPFQQTARDVRKYVEAHPGCRMADVMENVEHHYQKDSTARSCLSGYIGRGIIRGIEARLEGKGFKFYPVSGGEEAAS